MMADTPPESPAQAHSDSQEVLAPENAPSASGALTPMAILQAMTTNGSQPDPDAINSLLDAQEKWERREAEKAFHTAFIAMQETMPSIYKTKNVAHNGKHMYDHEELPNMLDILKPHLRKHGFYPRWETETLENGNMRVTCFITHSLGHFIFSEMSGVPDTSGAKNAIQATGSTASYLERYTLKAVLGISASDKDDDGKAAENAPVTAEQSAHINTELDRLEADKGAFCKYMKVEAIPHILSKDYGKADAALKAKDKKQKEGAPHEDT